MRRLSRRIFDILRSFPDNTLHTDSEIWWLVSESFPRNTATRRDDLARALGDVNEKFGLVGGFFVEGEAWMFGIALRSKITEMPVGAQLLIGASLANPQTRARR